MGRRGSPRNPPPMPDEKKALLEALKIAKAGKHGLPMQIQDSVTAIAKSTDAADQRKRANEVSRWLYAESNQPGIDQFTVMGYNALRNALAPFIPQE